MIKYYVDINGVYKGGFEGDHGIDVSAYTEVPNPPESGNLIWNGTTWECSKDDLKDHLANHRWQKETGGIVFNGLPVRTDDRSKLLLSAIQSQIENNSNPNNTRKVKTSAGFVVLTDAQLAALYIAVVDHVQNCFDIEDAVVGLIDNDTLTTNAEVEAEFDAQFALL